MVNVFYGGDCSASYSRRMETETSRRGLGFDIMEKKDTIGIKRLSSSLTTPETFGHTTKVPVYGQIKANLVYFYPIK